MEYIKQKDLVRYRIEISSIYEAIHDPSGSYFADEKGEPIVYYGGFIGGGDSLGFGSQISPDVELPLPSSMHIRWFNRLDNQFWAGHFILPKDKLAELFKRCDHIDEFDQNRSKICPYYTFIINAVPTGQVFVYIGGRQIRFIGQYQAQKADMDWAQFYLSLGYPKTNMATREEYVASIRKAFNNPGYADKEVAALKETPSPYEPAYWNRFFKKYDWILISNKPNQLVEYVTWYVNGERLTTYEHSANNYHNAAVPYAIKFTVKKEDGSHTITVMEFDEKYIMEKFEQLGAAGKPIEFHADFDDAYNTLDTYLTLKGEHEKIELVPTRVESMD